MNQESQVRYFSSQKTDGTKFRPSDWIERLACHLSTFKDSRLRYSKYIYPLYVQGIKCLAVDNELQNYDFDFYCYVYSFIKSNNLEEILI